MATSNRGLLLLCLASSAYSYDAAARMFAQFLFKELARDDTRNVVYSPLGVSTGLAMLLQATGGSSAAQLEEFIGLTADAARRTYGALNYYMMSFLPNATSVTSMQTRLFLRDGISVKAAFINLLAGSFTTAISYVDFGSEGAKDVLNAWVNEYSDGTIPNILTRDPSVLTLLILANTVYFKGLWQYRFNVQNTQTGTFYVSPDEEVSVPFMSNTLTTLGGRSFRLNVTWVILPFQDTNFRMVLMMPFDNFDMERVVREKTVEIWNSIRTESTSGRWRIQLPRFKLEGRHDLKMPLQCMGAQDVFDDEKSNLTALSNFRPLSLTRYIHKAVFEINERGARPPVTSGAGAIQDFIANQPFIAVVADWVTRVPLIASLVRDPTEVPSEL